MQKNRLYIAAALFVILVAPVAGIDSLDCSASPPSPAPQPSRSGGPDAFGYTYRDNYGGDTANYNYTEIASYPPDGAWNPHGDDAISTVKSIGFTFSFYGINYNYFFISNNGIIHVAQNTTPPTAAPFGNTALSSSGLTRAICPWWDDLYTGGVIYWKTLGSAPKRVLLIEYSAINHRSYQTGYVTFEAALFESGNIAVALYYKDANFQTGSGSYDKGWSATVGIQMNSTAYLQYSCNVNYLDASRAIEFLNPPLTPPGTPTLNTPANNTRLTANSVTLGWTVGTGPAPTLYYVHFGTDATPGIYTTTVTASCGPIATTDATTYYWYVVAHNAGGNSTRSEIFTFRENGKPPDPTTPVSPPSGTTGLSYGASFQAVTWTSGGADPDSDTVTYYWYVDTDATPASPYTDYGSTTGTSSSLVTTAASTRYYWNLRAWDGYEYSSYSPTWWFETVNMAPNAPASVAVDGFTSGDGIMHIVTSQPVFTWSFSDPDAGDAQAGYQVKVGTTANGSEMWDSGDVTGSAATAAYNGLALSDGACYNISVRVLDGHGSWGNYSSALQFRLNTPPNAPGVPILPGDGAVVAPTSAQTVNWTAGAGDSQGDTVYFFWYVDTESPPSSPYTASGGSAAYTNSTIFTAAPSVQYFWRVRAYDGYEYSSWSPTYSFTTDTNPPNAPSSLKVDGKSAAPDVLHIVPHAPRLSWTYSDPDSDAQKSYQIQVGTTSGGSQMWDSGTVASGSASANYTGSALVDGATYYFRVRVQDVKNAWSQWATPLQFRMNSLPPVPVTPITPSNSALVPFGPGQTVVWTAGSADPENDTVTYQWVADTDNPPSSPYVASGSSGAFANSTGFTTLPETAYFWQARSYDGYEYSAWTAVWTFQTESRPPNAPSSLTVQGQSAAPGITHIIMHKPALGWAFSDPDAGDTQGGYNISVYSQPNKTGILLWNSGQVSGAATSVLYGGTTALVDGATYYLRVSVKDGHNVWSAESETSFRMNSPPAAPSLAYPANSATNSPAKVNLTWAASSDDEGDSASYYWFVGTADPPAAPYTASGSGPATQSAQLALGPLTKYYWRAYANDSYEASLWSATWSFTTEDKDVISPFITYATPANATVVADSMASVVALFSEKIQRATVTYSCSPDPGGWSVQYAANDTMATFTHTGPFAINTAYTFQVTQAKDLADNGLAAGPVPNPWTFRTPSRPPDAPAALSVQGQTAAPGILHIIMHKPVLGWAFSDPDSGDTQSGYHIVVSTASGGGGTVLWNSGSMNGTTGSASYGGSAMADGQQYYYRVRTRDSHETWSNWSEVAFRMNSLPSAPALKVPANGATGISTAFNLEWAAASDADTDALLYTWRVGTANPPVSPFVSNGTTADNSTSTIFGASATKYYWQILANDSWESRLSAVWNFTTGTKDTIPPRIVDTFPADGSTLMLLAGDVIVNFSEPITAQSLQFSCAPDPAPGGWTIKFSNGGATARMAHNRPFVGGIVYTFAITRANDTGSNALSPWAAPNPWNFTAFLLTGPTISQVSPANNSMNITLDATISVTFNRPMNTSSVLLSSSPQVASLSPSWSAGDTIVAFAHSPLQPSTKYTLTVTAAADKNGTGMMAGPVPPSWSFTTIYVDQAAPTLTQASPQGGAVGVYLAAPVALTFSEAMAPASLVFASVPDPGGWSAQWSADSTAVTLTHADFSQATKYNFTLEACNDTAGNALAPGYIPGSWDFTTETVDLLAPEIVSVFPAPGSMNVGLGWPIRVNFSEAVVNSTLAFTCVPDPGGWGAAWTSPSSVVLSHAPFAKGARYDINVTAADDAYGNALSYSVLRNLWNFSTAADPVSVSLLSPDGNESFAPGQAASIRWHVSGGVAPYMIFLSLSTNDGATYGTSIAGQVNQTSAGFGSHAWTVPDISFSKCRVLCTAVDAGGQNFGSDVSNGSFSIYKPFPQGTLEGNVTDENGNPIYGARVSLVEAGLSNYTNEAGRYSLGPVDIGTYTLTVSMDGYKNYSIPLSVGAGLTQMDVITLARLATQESQGLPMLVVGGAAVAVFVVILFLLLIFNIFGFRTLILGRRKKGEEPSKGDHGTQPSLYAQKSSSPRPEYTGAKYSAVPPPPSAVQRGSQKPSRLMQPMPQKGPSPQQSPPRPAPGPQPVQPQAKPPPPPMPPPPKVQISEAEPPLTETERKGQLEEITAPGNKCPDCGRINDIEDYKCFWCGAWLKI